MDVEISWVAQLGCCLRPSPRSNAAQNRSERKASWPLALSSDAGSLDCALMAFSNHRTPAVIQRGDRSPAIRLATKVLIDGRPTLTRDDLFKLAFGVLRAWGLSSSGCCC